MPKSFFVQCSHLAYLLVYDNTAYFAPEQSSKVNSELQQSFSHMIVIINTRIKKQKKTLIKMVCCCFLNHVKVFKWLVIYCIAASVPSLTKRKGQVNTGK